MKRSDVKLVLMFYRLSKQTQKLILSLFLLFPPPSLPHLPLQSLCCRRCWSVQVNVTLCLKVSQTVCFSWGRTWLTTPRTWTTGRTCTRSASRFTSGHIWSAETLNDVFLITLIWRFMFFNYMKWCKTTKNYETVRQEGIQQLLPQRDLMMMYEQHVTVTCNLTHLYFRSFKKCRTGQSLWSRDLRVPSVTVWYSGHQNDLVRFRKEDGSGSNKFSSVFVTCIMYVI